MKTKDELQMDAEMKAYHEAMDKYYAEILTHNEAVLKENNIPIDDFKNLTEAVDFTGKIEIVKKPTGTSNDEEHGIFTATWVDQWSVGMEGDSFEGYIYGKLDENKWLKIPYSC